MSFYEALLSALQALNAHKQRAALTMLGIIIGVAAVIAMVAIGGGARQQVAAQIRSLGANLLIVLPGNITLTGVRLGSGASNTLTDLDAEAITREISSVQTSAPTLRPSVQIVAGSQNWATFAFGIDQGYFEAREWEVEIGRSFTAEEIQRGGQVVIGRDPPERQLRRQTQRGVGIPVLEQTRAAHRQDTLAERGEGREHHRALVGARVDRWRRDRGFPQAHRAVVRPCAEQSHARAHTPFTTTSKDPTVRSHAGSVLTQT